MDDALPLGIRAWFARMGADIFTDDEIDIAADDAKQRDDRLANADALAEMIDLQYEDRKRLGIFTIGAVDMTKRQRANARKQRKLEHDRIKRKAKRRERGAPSREQYLAESLSRAKPWEAEGVSRRTWERRRQHDASSAPPHTSKPSAQPATPGHREAVGRARDHMPGAV